MLTGEPDPTPHQDSITAALHSGEMVNGWHVATLDPAIADGLNSNTSVTLLGQYAAMSLRHVSPDGTPVVFIANPAGHLKQSAQLAEGVQGIRLVTRSIRDERDLAEVNSTPGSTAMAHQSLPTRAAVRDVADGRVAAGYGSRTGDPVVFVELTPGQYGITAGFMNPVTGMIHAVTTNPYGS